MSPPPPGLPAEPPPEHSDHGYAALGVLVGAGGNWLYGAYDLEAGATIPHAPYGLRVRGLLVLKGGTMESDWSGEFSRFGAGAELRRCFAYSIVCAFLDLDFGRQHLTMNDDSGDQVRDHTGVFVGPRIGLDLGTGLRARFAFEAYRQVSGAKTFGTGALALAVGYQF